MSGIRHNCCSVDLKFASRLHAEQFYFDSPGEGMISGLSVYKCVEGDADAADRLEQQGRAARYQKIEVDRYSVEEELTDE